MRESSFFILQQNAILETKSMHKPHSPLLSDSDRMYTPATDNFNPFQNHTHILQRNLTNVVSDLIGIISIFTEYLANFHQFSFKLQRKTKN